MADPLAFLVSMVTFSAVYAILALGLNLQWGYTGLFNLSVAAFWGVGAYTATLITKPPAADTAFGFGVPYLWVDVAGIPLPLAPAIVVAAVVSGVVALIIGIPTLGLEEEYLAIASLGFAEIIRLVFVNENWLAGGVLGTSVDSPLSGMEDGSLVLLAVTVVVVGLVYVVLKLLVTSPWGRVLKSIREDETVAEALGKNAFVYKIQSLVIGSMIMGMAGAITALQLNYVSPSQFTAEWTVYIWIAVILGGGGSVRGAVLGGFALTLLLEGTRFLNQLFVGLSSNVLNNVRIMAIGLILIAFIIYRPQGLLGDTTIIRDMKE